MRLARRYSTLVLQVGLFCSQLLAADAQHHEVKLLNNPVIRVDWASGHGEAVLYVRNESNKGATVGLTGSFSDGKRSPLTVHFGKVGDSSNARELYDLVLGRRETAPVLVSVANDWDDGDVDLNITDTETTARIGTLKINRPPFAVRFSGNSPDKATLSMTDGQRAYIRLKNDGTVGYSLSWKLSNNNADFCSGNNAVIPPMSVAVLECTPSVPMVVANALSICANLLKADSIQDGYFLALSPAASATGASGPMPLTLLPVEASVDSFSSTTRAAAGYVILICVLIAGGICSLLLSYSLPNRLQRLNTKEDLDSLARRTASLSTRIDSKVAVLVRLERSRLQELLRSRNTLSPDFSALITQCREGVTKLKLRMEILEGIDVVLARLSEQLPRDLPPTQRDVVDKSVQGVNALLSKADPSDTDIEAARKLATDVTKYIDQIGLASDAFGQRLASDIRSIATDVSSSLLSLEPFKVLNGEVPLPYAKVQQFPATAQTVPPDEYVPLDMAVHKLRLIRTYVWLRQGTSDSTMVNRLSERETDFARMLQHDNWDNLRSARLLLQEMKDDVYPKQLVEALERSGEVSIEMDQLRAYERTALGFCVRFHSDALNNAAAREEWDCYWDFGDGMKGQGWSVSHYFLLRHKNQSDKYTVTVTFNDSQGKQIVNAAGEALSVATEVNVWPSVLGKGLGERSVTEAVKLGAALLIAVFGLVAGAKDQLAKLDLLPGLVAVFLLGFGADTIKNILSSKT